MAVEVHFKLNQRKLKAGIRAAVRNSITSTPRTTMSKKKPIEVEIIPRRTTKKGKPVLQYTYAIDKPGPGAKDTKGEWYFSASNARRAAAAELGAQFSHGTGMWWAGERQVVFSTKPAKKK